jgi:ribonuclease-3
MIGRRNPYRALEKALGHRFRRRDLLRAALTHRSYRFESAEGERATAVEPDNQRLEFLGDAVLGLLTAEHVFDAYADAREGTLTTARSRVTSGKALAALAASLELGAHLHVGRGEESSGGRGRESNLADALEAVLGAVYCDGGIRAARKVFSRLFVPLVEGLADDPWEGNPKGRLQELAQARWKTSPVYRLVRREGPAHNAVFSVEVVVKGRARGVGKGRNKQQAERQAARRALERLAADQH